MGTARRHLRFTKPCTTSKEFLKKKKKQQKKVYNHCTTEGNLHRSYWTLQAFVHEHESAVRLTRLLVGLLVWPDDGAEAGEDQRAQSAGSFLWSTVVVQGVLAQHEPVPTLLDPVASHLP